MDPDRFIAAIATRSISPQGHPEDINWGRAGQMQALQKLFL